MCFEYDSRPPPLPRDLALPGAAGGAKADLKLNKTRNLAAQLSNGEWLASAPGTMTQKRPLLSCVGCHTPLRTNDFVFTKPLKTRPTPHSTKRLHPKAFNDSMLLTHSTE